MKPVIASLALACLFANPAWTQQANDPDSLEYQYPTEIIITAPRMALALKEAPFAASIVGDDVLKELPRGVAVDEPLKLVPGVKVDNQANGSRVHLSMRGQGILTERGIRGIKILYDGIPINDPTGFAPDFFDIDFSAVDRIEVLRGTAASLYGGSAAGGIINISSMNAQGTPLFGDALVTSGSNNFLRSFGRFGGDVNKVNYTVSFSRAIGDGYRQHTHFWGNNVYGKAIYTPSSSIQLTPIFGYTRVYHENPEGIDLATYKLDPKLPNPDAIPFNEHLETERTTNGLKGTVLILDRHELEVVGYVKRTRFVEANNHTYNHRTLVTPGASLQFTYGSGDSESTLRNHMSVGTDLQWQTIDEYRVENMLAVEGSMILSRERIKQRGAGVFLAEKLDIGKYWSFLANIRYDNIRNELEDMLASPYDLSGDATFSKTTGRVGLTYTPIPELNVYANWGQGFLPPATEELAQNPDHFGGFNTHLTAATSNSYELGLRGSLKEQSLYYDMAGFYMTTENDFDRYRISDSLRNQETFYRNIGSSRRFGAELYVRYTPTQTADIRVAYTYSHFKYTNATPVQILMDDPTILKYAVDGNSLPNSPEHQLYVDLLFKPVDRFFIGVSAEVLSKAFIDGANVEGEAVEGYALVHARAGYNWTFSGLSGELSFTVRNLGDVTYVAFSEPDPGGNSYQPGAGREFFGSFRVSL